MNPVLTTVAVIFLLAFILKFSMNTRINRSIGKPAPDLSEINGRTFGPDENSMVYFYGPHRRACKPMTPVVKAMGETRKNVYAVDINEHPRLARDFALIAIPTVMLVRNGLISQVRVGTLSRTRLEQMLSSDSA